MPIVVGVTFRNAGKVYYFSPGQLELHEGMAVLAQTARGLEYGVVAVEPREVPAEEVVSPLKPVVRLATEADTARAKANREREREAFAICQQKIAEHNLPMKLIEAEITFDGSRMVFYFGAESRVDFRALVKDLAGTFKTRIELRQVGVRDEAKLMGGIGGCGRPLCCATFMSNFEPVGIKMAKEQGLSLNPLKISGVCGRLLCCLNYEYAFYKSAKERFPKVGSQIETARGPGRVIEISVPKETVTVALDEGGHVEYPLGELNLGENSPCAAGGVCRKEGSRHPRRRPEGDEAPAAACPGCLAAHVEPPRAERPQRSRPPRRDPAPVPAEQPTPASAEAPKPPAAPTPAASQVANGGGQSSRHKSHRARRPRFRRRRKRAENSGGAPA